MINRCNTSGKWSEGWPSTGLNWTNILHSIQKIGTLPGFPWTAAAIMRVAMYEILYMPEIPAAAAINDAGGDRQKI